MLTTEGKTPFTMGAKLVLLDTSLGAANFSVAWGFDPAFCVARAIPKPVAPSASANTSTPGFDLIEDAKRFMFPSFCFCARCHDPRVGRLRRFSISWSKTRRGALLILPATRDIQPPRLGSLNSYFC